MSGISGDRSGLASVGRAHRRWGLGLAAGLAVATFAACSTTTSPEQRPSEASIRVTGSTPGPLRLIVSTDFFETFDPVEQIREQVFVTADTMMIDALPYSGSVTLSELSSIVVDLSNPDETPATVRLVVELDGNQPPYDREAEMSLGGALRYVYNWVAPSL